MKAKLHFPWLLGATALMAFAVMAQEPAQSGPRVIEMSAGNYEFMPSTVHVKAGERIELKVTDKEHGIRIKPIPQGASEGAPPGIEITSGEDCVKFKKQQSGTIEFTARTPGTYLFDCCKLCGFGHGKMKGEIIVDP